MLFNLKNSYFMQKCDRFIIFCTDLVLSTMDISAHPPKFCPLAVVASQPCRGGYSPATNSGIVRPPYDDALLTKGKANINAHPEDSKLFAPLNGIISCGEIKLLEEFVGFCKMKRVSIRESNADSFLRNYLIPLEIALMAIHSISVVFQQNKQLDCSSCNTVQDDLVIRAHKIACDSIIKNYSSNGFSLPPIERSYHATDSINVVEDATGSALCKQHLPPVDTPAGKEVFANQGSNYKTQIVTAHRINKRTRGGYMAKHIHLPRTKLFFKGQVPEEFHGKHLTETKFGSQHTPRAAVIDNAIAQNAIPQTSDTPKTDLFNPEGMFDLEPDFPDLEPGQDDEITTATTKKNEAIISKIQVQPNQKNVIVDVKSTSDSMVPSTFKLPRNVIFNEKHSTNFHKNILNPNGTRFPVSTVNLHFYDILCGLAYSQWKCEVVVEFGMTKVTFESLGQSIEPRGHCENFFIAGHCRNYFELCHPRKSKKHYFYPSVGHSMLLYNTPYHKDVVQKCFLGANSALKLHLVDKLFFPTCHSNHWFVFAVDLKEKQYLFFDSFYDQSHPFQVHVSDKMIETFKIAWGLHAQGNVDLCGFTTVYPPVPKQDNADDRGIFCIKYMELWNNDGDLRQMFSKLDIPNIRVILGSELYFSPKNLKDKSIVNNLYRQGLDPRLF